MGRGRAGGPLISLCGFLLCTLFIVRQVMASPSASRNIDELSAANEISSSDIGQKSELDHIRNARSSSADPTNNRPNYFNFKPISEVHPGRPARRSQGSEEDDVYFRRPARKQADKVDEHTHSHLVAALISIPDDDWSAGTSDFVKTAPRQRIEERVRYKREAVNELEEICEKVMASKHRRMEQKNVEK